MERVCDGRARRAARRSQRDSGGVRHDRPKRDRGCLAAAGRALVRVRAARSRGVGAGRARMHARSRPPARTGSASWRAAGARSPARRSQIRETVRPARVSSPSGASPSHPTVVRRPLERLRSRLACGAEVSLARRGGRASVTVNLEAGAGRHGGRRACRTRGAAGWGAAERAAAARRPAPTGAYRVQSSIPRPLRGGRRSGGAADPFGGAGEDRARSRGRRARADRARSGGAARRAARGVRHLYVFAVGRGDEHVRRRQPGAAGSARRPAGEHRSRWPARSGEVPILPSTTTSGNGCCEATRTGRRTRSSPAGSARAAPLSVWVTSPPEPALVRVANIQHLATPIRAQLASPSARSSWRARCTRRRPWAASRARTAVRLIPALEGLDRGWYAGAVAGPTPPGTASSALRCRCALVREDRATVRRVRDRRRLEPAAELAETEVKLGALLPLLAG